MGKIVLREYEEKKLKCPYCGSEDLYLDSVRGELVCKKCGAVIESELIDFGKEWRVFEDTDVDSVARASGSLALRLPDMGTITLIGKTEDYGEIPAELRDKFKELKKIQLTLVGKTDRNVRPALLEINRICSVLNLPQIVAEDAARIYRKAAERNLIRGRSMESVIAAAIYIAARQNKVPITLKDLENVIGLPSKEIGKTFRYISKQLDIKVLPMTTEEYIYKIVAELKLPAKVLNLALRLLEYIRKKGLLSGKGPNGVAAALVYISAILQGVQVNIKDLTASADVTEVTIRSRVKEIITKLKLQNKIKEALQKYKKNLINLFL